MPKDALQHRSLQIPRAMLAAAAMTCGLLACFIPYGQDEGRLISQWLSADVEVLMVFEQPKAELELVSDVLAGVGSTPEELELLGIELEQPLVIAHLEGSGAIGVVAGRGASDEACQRRLEQTLGDTRRVACQRRGDHLLLLMGASWVREDTWLHQHATFHDDGPKESLLSRPWFNEVSEELTTWPTRAFMSQRALLEAFSAQNRWVAWLLADIDGVGVALERDSDLTAEVVLALRGGALWLPRLTEVSGAALPDTWSRRGTHLHVRLQAEGLISSLRQAAMESTEADTLLALGAGLGQALGGEGIETFIDALSGDITLDHDGVQFATNTTLEPETFQTALSHWCDTKGRCTTHQHAERISITLPDGAHVWIRASARRIEVGWTTDGATRRIEHDVEQVAARAPLGGLRVAVEPGNPSAGGPDASSVALGIEREGDQLRLSATIMPALLQPILASVSFNRGEGGSAIPPDVLKARLASLADSIDLHAAQYGLPHTLVSLVERGVISTSEHHGDGGETMLYRTPAEVHRYRRYDLCVRGADRQAWTEDDVCLR